MDCTSRGFIFSLNTNFQMPEGNPLPPARTGQHFLILVREDRANSGETCLIYSSSTNASVKSQDLGVSLKVLKGTIPQGAPKVLTMSLF